MGGSRCVRKAGGMLKHCASGSISNGVCPTGLCAAVPGAEQPLASPSGWGTAKHLSSTPKSLLAPGMAPRSGRLRSAQLPPATGVGGGSPLGPIWDFSGLVIQAQVLACDEAGVGVSFQS